MNIGIFGGCFNPPHRMHKNMALKLIENKTLDKIIYVPTGIKYNKSDLISNTHRYNMLKIICNDSPYLEVSDYEFKDELTYAYQTLDYFKSIYPNDNIYYIIGGDNLKTLNEWKNFEYLMKNYKFLVINRNADNYDNLISKYKKYENSIVLADNIEDDISSTFIRNQIKNNKYNIEDYLNKDVLDYIKENSLYID